jgi:CcmD family protein
MKQNKKTATLAILSLPMCVSMYAQPAQNTTGLMHAEGRIYVVVAVVLTILIGLFAYLFMLDRKINKLEKNQTN